MLAAPCMSGLYMGTSMPKNKSDDSNSALLAFTCMCQMKLDFTLHLLQSVMSPVLSQMGLCRQGLVKVGIAHSSSRHSCHTHSSGRWPRVPHAAAQQVHFQYMSKTHQAQFRNSVDL